MLGFLAVPALILGSTAVASVVFARQIARGGRAPFVRRSLSGIGRRLAVAYALFAAALALGLIVFWAVLLVR